MRRPLRKPHGINTSDIENFESTAKYVIYLDGTSYVAINGDTGVEDSRSTSAHTVIQYAIDNGGAGVVSVKCDVALTAGITGAANVILDGNNHTITPATSFVLITMKPHFHLKNLRIDVSGLVFTHTCIYLDGADQYNTTNNPDLMQTIVENIHALSDSQRGRFMWFDCDAAAESIAWVIIKDIFTANFEYGYLLEASANVANCWVNANTFENIRGNQDEFFIFLTRGGVTANLHGNIFKNIQFQCSTDVDTVITVDGKFNWFDGVIWDIEAGSTQVNFTANSENNIVTGGTINHGYITWNGASNFAFSPFAQGFMGNDSFQMFLGTHANPIFSVNGWDGANKKTISLQVPGAGDAHIFNSAGQKIYLYASDTLELNHTAADNINCFSGSGTDENRLLQISGRNNADTANEEITLQWGDGTHEDGEIKTTSGDLRLSPSGYVRFGTKTGTGDAVLDGYVTIKDAAGNTIKLATTA